MSEKKYILYDGRAVSMGTDEASVLEVCDSLKEAKHACKEYGDAAVYEYDLVAEEFVNQRLVYVHNG